MMDIAIEKGLNGRRVKVGDGEKTPGYAIGTSKLKSFLCIVFGYVLRMSTPLLYFSTARDVFLLNLEWDFCSQSPQLATCASS